MNESKRRGPPPWIRPVVLLLLLAVGGFFVWKYATRREDYRGGNVETTGTIEAVQVQLGFRVGGKIAGVSVSEGDRVRGGQVVATLETQDLDVMVESARAVVASARASVAQAQANRNRNRLELERGRLLLSKGFMASQAMDTILAASKVSEAQVIAAQAQVRQAESSLSQAELQRSYAVLRAPEGGEVLERVHLPGEIVAAGVPVVSIAHTDTVKVHAAVDETRVGAVRPGDRVVLRVYTFDRRLFPGAVTDITAAGEFATRKDWGARRRDIRTFTVNAAVPNPEHLLKDGMTAEVTIEVSPAVQADARAKR
jgi:RND family efflux transporter MFP subunit